MITPYGLEITESCLACKMRSANMFYGLSPAALQAFETIKYATAYPKEAVLFVEGQNPRGIFVLCKGRVKLTLCSSTGKTLIMKIAEPGEVLGLSATISGKPYEVMAETAEPCQINFVRREDFLHFLRQHSEAGLRVAEQLSNKYTSRVARSGPSVFRIRAAKKWPNCCWIGAHEMANQAKLTPVCG